MVDKTHSQQSSARRARPASARVLAGLAIGLTALGYAAYRFEQEIGGTAAAAINGDALADDGHDLPQIWAEIERVKRLRDESWASYLAYRRTVPAARQNALFARQAELRESYGGKLPEMSWAAEAPTEPVSLRPAARPPSFPEPAQEVAVAETLSAYRDYLGYEARLFDLRGEAETRLQGWFADIGFFSRLQKLGSGIAGLLRPPADSST